jgi:SAM-dependent methyltransferase
MRAALNVLHTYAPPKSNSHIYITERLTKTYEWLATRYPMLQGSEYFGPSYSPGSTVDGIRHEDVMNLSFDDDSFDRVLSFDVLEHVPDPDSAFSELFRVLKPGGTLIFSVPFSSDSPTDIVRASIEGDGSITHHMPAEYHGNPVDPEGGALCFRYFGWEMLDMLRNIGFSNVRCLAYWSEEQGYLGQEQYLFMAMRPIEEDQ